jgi:hypothetical protein
LEFARHTEIIASKRILPSLEYVEGGFRVARYLSLGKPDAAGVYATCDIVMG